jgi:predicted neuraminidase
MRISCRWLICWLFLCQAVVLADEPTFPGLVKREFIYEQASFPECHASSIAETTTGTLITTWFGGTKEKHPDVCIWVSRLTDKGWSAPAQVADGIQADGKRHPCWNPVLYQIPTGPLVLFYKVGPNPIQWWGLMRTSTDDGLTWSEAQKLPEGMVGPIKNKPVALSDGQLLYPTSTEDQGWRLHFERSTPDLKQWSKTEAINLEKDASLIQPSILFHANGQLQALCRSKNKFIFSTWSSDQGKTWSKPEPITLPCPNSGIDAVTLKNGQFLLVYNHVHPGIKINGWSSRSPLNLAQSTDGKQWNAVGVLENAKGEYSYPAVIQTRDGRVHVTYTWQRKKVAHLVIDPQQLVGKPIENGQWPEMK